MDEYKKIIKSKQLREKIVNFFSFLPDKLMLPIQYRIKLKRKLNLNNPQRFTEKIQWYKMSYRKPIMHTCVDKLAVREYVKSKGLENILVRLYGVYDSLEDVNYDKLPNKFVMKTTNGVGGLNVYLCKDKDNIDFIELNKKLKLIKYKENQYGREWAYYNVEPKLIVEELLENESNPKAGINDYKFLCFNGKVKYVVVDVDRYIGHKRNIYDANWNNMNIQTDCEIINREIEKPNNLSRMIEYAERLSNDFPFARVDLYSVNNNIFFGEITFYPWSGYVQFQPDKYDCVLGNEWVNNND